MLLVPRWDWLDVGSHKESYPPRLRELRRAKANGVYVIRHKVTSEVWYVGESHSNCMYQTLTRHLQAPMGEGFSRYFVIERSLAEVDWIITPGGTASTWLEDYLIRLYRPRGNFERDGSEPSEELDEDFEYRDLEAEMLARTDEVADVPF